MKRPDLLAGKLVWLSLLAFTFGTLLFGIVWFWPK